MTLGVKLEILPFIFFGGRGGIAVSGRWPWDGRTAEGRGRAAGSASLPCAPRKGPYTQKALFSLPFFSCLLLTIFRYCDRRCYCHQKVPGPRAKPSEDSTRPREVPWTWAERAEKLPCQTEGLVLSSFYSCPLAGCWKKENLILFQRYNFISKKKIEQKQPLHLGEGIVFTGLEKEEQSYGEVSY